MNNPWNDIATPKNAFAVRLFSSTHPLRLFWGKDSQSRYVLVIEAPPDALPKKQKLPELKGINVLIWKTVNTLNIALILKETANWEIFLTLCNDLIRASKNAENDHAAVSILLRRLVRWQEFLKRDRDHTMSPEEIKGLIGELLFLTSPLAEKYGWDTAISFWKGPEDAPQDFAVHDTAVEIKCQSGSSKPCIQINSIEQLNSKMPSFFLVVYTLATSETENEGAFTLNSLIVKIRSALEEADESTRERFEMLLFQAGYIPLKFYDEKIFQRIATQIFGVTEKFPRLTAAQIPEGINRVSYQISLEACAPFETELQF